MEFNKTYELLENCILDERAETPYMQADPIDLHQCRSIMSTKLDNKGEYESSSCLMYDGALTRISAKALIFRDGEKEKEVLVRFWRTIVELPGGGFDLEKDNFDIKNTIKREVLEEVNINITNIRETGLDYWKYAEKDWVKKYVENPEDRWNGYYVYLFTADYDGQGDNDIPEELGRYKWYPVSEILNRPDSPRLKIYKEAIIKNGYDKAALQETVELTEEKQLGLVSYCVHDTGSTHALQNLADILENNYIKASTESDGSKYISTSRNLSGHLGPKWKCGLVLDGTVLTNKYQVKPVAFNSVLFHNNSKSRDNKTLELQSIQKYQAIEEPEKTFNTIRLFGSSFVTTITDQTYNIIKRIMELYNDQMAVSTTRGNAEYQGQPNKKVKKYTDKYPVLGMTMQGIRVPNIFKKYKYHWQCIESIGYDVKHSGFYIQRNFFLPYKDTILAEFGVDITSNDFFRQLTGRYADESEERFNAKSIKLIKKDDEEILESDEDFGLELDNSIKGILIDIKHKPAFTTNTKSKFFKLADDDGNIIKDKYDKIPNLKNIVTVINNYADSHNIPIIFWNYKTNPAMIMREINNYKK